MCDKDCLVIPRNKTSLHPPFYVRGISMKIGKGVTRNVDIPALPQIKYVLVQSVKHKERFETY